MIRNSLGGENTTTPPIINFYLRPVEETYVYCGLTVNMFFVLILALDLGGMNPGQIREVVHSVLKKVKK